MTVTVKSLVLLYVPAAWFAPTDKVPPTERRAVPPVSVPPAATVGVLVNVFRVMSLAGVPLDKVMALAGKVIEKVMPTKPVMLKVAAETVPVEAGSVGPLVPVTVLVPAGAITTVPAAVPAAMLPKLKFVALTMEMGVIIVADAVAVASAAFALTAVKPKKARVKVIILNVFIVVEF